MLPSLRLLTGVKGLKNSSALNTVGLKNGCFIGPKEGSFTGSRKNLIHPKIPVRTRFAPSPTGMLHLGSLRTALYNFLLARQTGGQFLVRLEDTDQTRLVSGAEENLYAALKWAGIIADESPEVGGPYGPYKQSERGFIYQKYIDILLEKDLAYKCYCSKGRLLKLKESAQKLRPPTTVSYDRKCFHDPPQKSDEKEYVVRFKSPDIYPITEDLQRGSLDIQPQINHQDRRYDDFIIMKLDRLPTYHFANIVDDHLMQINYVIRGEEWLTSTPKHLALYQAFGWTPPKFVHVPLLTSLDERKLSKRHGDSGVLSFQKKGISPEALVNFVALFGWSPRRKDHGKKVKEVMTLFEMIEKFRLDDMTRGNIKVSDAKLWYFNRHHLPNSLRNPAQLEKIADLTFDDFSNQVDAEYDLDYYKKCLSAAAGHIDRSSDLYTNHSYLFREVDYDQVEASGKEWILPILEHVLEKYRLSGVVVDVDGLKKSLSNEKALRIMQSIRFALAGSVPGLDIKSISTILGNEKYEKRLEKAIEFLKYKYM